MALARACSDCHQELPRSEFSANQWRKGVLASRCKACIANPPTQDPLYALVEAEALAEAFGLRLVAHNKASRVVSFTDGTTRFNCYYTTGTVGTCLEHPKQGKTQMFRRNQTALGLRDIFANPRAHTGAGYQSKGQLAQGGAAAAAAAAAAATTAAAAAGGGGGGGGGAAAAAASPQPAKKTAPRFLLVAGSMFDIEDDFWLASFKKAFARVPAASFDVLDMTARPLLPAVQSGKYSCVVIMSIGSGGDDSAVTSGAVGRALANWTAQGGHLFLHGEGPLHAFMATHFGTSWERGSYSRTEHALNASHHAYEAAFHGATNMEEGGGQQQLPRSCNVKACMVCNVPAEERLYATGGGSKTHSAVPFMAGLGVDEGMCAVALKTHGKGHVLFFGDVNAEQSTVTILVLLGMTLAGRGQQPAVAAGAKGPVPVCARPSCGAPSSQKCGRCKDARYCGRSCQTKDWKRHKRECNQVQKVLEVSSFEELQAAVRGTADGGALTIKLAAGEFSGPGPLVITRAVRLQGSGSGAGGSLLAVPLRVGQDPHREKGGDLLISNLWAQKGGSIATNGFHHIDLQDVTFTEHAGSGNDCLVIDAGGCEQGVDVKDCRVYGGDDGLFISGGQVLVKGSEIRFAQSRGIFANPGFAIESSIVSDCGSYGIKCRGGYTDLGGCKIQPGPWDPGMGGPFSGATSDYEFSCEEDDSSSEGDGECRACCSDGEEHTCKEFRSRDDDDDEEDGWATTCSESDEDVGVAPPRLPRRGTRYPCQLCGVAMAAGNGYNMNINFCRPDGRTEGKSLQWALDSDLYEATRSDVLCVCGDHSRWEIPAPWGDGPALRDVSAAEVASAIASVGSVCERCGCGSCLCESESDY